MSTRRRGIRRRDVLRGVGGAATVALAGCTGGDGSGSDGTVTPEAQLATPVAGEPDAPVTVAAFEDFACPHCATYSLETLPPIWNEYVEPGEVRYEWWDFPIPVDEEQSWLAHNAARSVQDNADAIDAFWEFEELLFENQRSLSLDTYETLANQVGVDGATVRQAAEDRTYQPTVLDSRKEGERRGVSATPTVYVAGEAIQAPSTDDLREAIDAALADA